MSIIAGRELRRRRILLNDHNKRDGFHLTQVLPAAINSAPGTNGVVSIVLLYYCSCFPSCYIPVSVVACFRGVKVFVVHLQPAASRQNSSSLNPSGTAVPFWGHTTQIPSSLYQNETTAALNISQIRFG